MSTIDREMTDDEIAGMVADLKEWPSIAHDNGYYELAVMPFLSIYFAADPAHHVETGLAMIDVHEAFERLLGAPFKIQTHPDSERPHPYGSKRLGNLREWARKVPRNKGFTFDFTDETNHQSSPTNAGYYWRDSDLGFGGPSYSSILLYYRWQWWLDNRDAWRRFVHDTITRLRPEQVYSGFAMANPLEFGTRSEVTVWDRALAPHFYGLDTDYPFTMKHHLPSGLRSPTWGFFLSDIWREKLSLDRDAVRAALADPRIRIDELDCGQWIELGPQPALYPVENGVPELPVMLNRLLRPLRHTNLDLLGFGEWDGDPNVRFNRRDTERWLARFDDDSDWPSSEVRGLAPDAPRQEPPLAHATGGEACPRTGWWVTSAKRGTRQHFEQGERLPIIESDHTHGMTLWQWDIDQREQITPPAEASREAQSLQPAPRAGLWVQSGQPLVRCRIGDGESLPLVDGVPVTWLWTEQPPPGMRATSGQPCPYPGVWHCEDIPIGPSTFMHGTPMPQVHGRDVTWFFAKAR
ncbi:type VI immunity family protein [Collimonas silvisoli]|uniref:type VI immunity family protein n=1 Tax=Collimonas silvisoli TaxID=2825884 RepID=UPI001B8BD7E8|nr:type VI immunity family protein [Collimonas silvisoli]